MDEHEEGEELSQPPDNEQDLEEDPLDEREDTEERHRYEPEEHLEDVQSDEYDEGTEEGQFDGSDTEDATEASFQAWTAKSRRKQGQSDGRVSVYVSLVAGFIGLIGLFFPWASFHSEGHMLFSRNGTQVGQGSTFAFFVVTQLILLIVAIRVPAFHRVGAWLAAGASIIAFGAVLWFAGKLANSGLRESVIAGDGWIATMFGTFISSWAAITAASKAPTPPPSPVSRKYLSGTVSPSLKPRRTSVERMSELVAMKESGVITAEEFDAKRRQILDEL